MRRAVWVIALLVVVLGQAMVPVFAQTPGTGESRPGEARAAEPLEIRVGMYILDLAKLDMKESEFYADFYIWFKGPQEKVTARNWSPQTIEFMNGSVESMTPLTVEDLPDGERYWIRRVKGNFRGRFQLHAYPFDNQELPIVIEDSDHPATDLVFRADLPEGRMPIDWVESTLQVPDWRKSGAQALVDRHQYTTDFGMMKQTESTHCSSM